MPLDPRTTQTPEQARATLARIQHRWQTQDVPDRRIGHLIQAAIAGRLYDQERAEVKLLRAERFGRDTADYTRWLALYEEDLDVLYALLRLSREQSAERFGRDLAAFFAQRREGAATP